MTPSGSAIPNPSRLTRTPQRLALEFASCTDIGRVRPHNEDALSVSPICGLAVLADGMGGYQAGEVASEMAVTLLKSQIEALLSNPSQPTPRGAELHLAITQCIQATNNAIFETSLHQPHCAGMGTTLVLTLFVDDRVVVAHVGDSRVYRYRAGCLEQLTRDHSFLQEQIDAGLITPAQARVSDQKNLVTRAVGVDPLTEPELHEYALQADDLYLLCSDGLTDMVDDPDIVTILATNKPLEAQARQLIAAANQEGGRDNISALLVKVSPCSSAATRGVLGRLKTWLS